MITFTLNFFFIKYTYVLYMDFKSIYPKYKYHLDHILKRFYDLKDYDDCYQDILIRIYRGCHTVKEPAKIKGWLHMVAYNSMTDYFRKRSHHQQEILFSEINKSSSRHSDNQDDPIDSELEFEDPKTPETILIQQVKLNNIFDALAKIPEPFQTPVYCRDFLGHSYLEVAAINDMNLGTVKSRIARGREAFKEIFDKLEE